MKEKSHIEPQTILFTVGFSVILYKLMLSYKSELLILVAPLFSKVFSADLTMRSEKIQLFTLLPIYLAGIILFILLLRGLTRLQRNGKIPQWVSLLMYLIIGLSFLFFAIISFHMRPAMDDYMNIQFIKTETLWGKSVSYYHEWSGRYSGPLVNWLFAIIPYRILIPGFPIFLIILIFLGSFRLCSIFIHQMDPSKDTQDWTLTITLSAAQLSIGTLLVTPDIISSIYWFSGSLGYGLGLGMTLLSFSLLFSALQSNRFSWIFWLAIAAAVFTVGTNELTAISMCIFSFSVWMWKIAFCRKKHKKALLFLLVNLACTAFSFAAPGNRARMTEHPQKIETSLLDWILHQMLGGMAVCYQGFWHSLMEHREVLLLTLFCCLLIGTFFKINRERSLLILWTAITLGLSSFCCFLTNATVMWAPDRALITPAAWVLATLGLLCFLCGSLLCTQKTEQQSLPVLMFCCVILIGISYHFYDNNIAFVSQFSRESDYREAQLLSADPTTLVVKTCKVQPLFKDQDDLSEDPDYWVNQRMAEFFSLKALSAKVDCASLLKNTTETTADAR